MEVIKIRKFNVKIKRNKRNPDFYDVFVGKKKKVTVMGLKEAMLIADANERILLKREQRSRYIK